MENNKTIKDVMDNGDRFVILNGFKESTEYVASLSNIKWVGEVKSYDGYSLIQCFETKKK